MTRIVLLLWSSYEKIKQRTSIHYLWLAYLIFANPTGWIGWVLDFAHSINRPHMHIVLVSRATKRQSSGHQNHNNWELDFIYAVEIIWNNKFFIDSGMGLKRLSIRIQLPLLYVQLATWIGWSWPNMTDYLATLIWKPSLTRSGFHIVSLLSKKFTSLQVKEVQHRKTCVLPPKIGISADMFNFDPVLMSKLLSFRVRRHAFCVLSLVYEFRRDPNSQD